MTSESRFGENRANFEKAARESQIYLIIAPHISKFLIVDIRVSFESDSLIRVADFAEMLSKEELTIFENAVSNNQDLRLQTGHLLKRTVGMIEHERPELGQVELAKIFMLVGSVEVFARSADGMMIFNEILKKVDSGSFTHGVANLVHYERQDGLKNLINGVEVAGVRTIWQRPKTV